MTRTERSVSPRALRKDRSEARNGLDSQLRKGGAGAHNWGSLDDEAQYEFEALRDEQEDFEEAAQDGDIVAVPSEVTQEDKVQRPQATRSPSEEERLTALRVRQQAFKKGEVNLSEIARSSAAVSGSPPRSASSFPTTD